MKKIIRPKQEEHAEYISDFSDKCFDQFQPDVEVKFEFNYGSKFDGSQIEFHLTDEEAKHVLDFIKRNLSQNKIKDLKNQLESNKVCYNDNIDARDWESCDYFGNCVDLFKYIIDENN